MKWTDEAEAALKKVPFFVRKKVRTRVEDQARSAGRKLVSLANLRTAQARFLAKMSEDVKGYRVQLGGKLGRHPRLAEELPGRYSEMEVLEIIKYCINFYKNNSTKGERFAERFKPSDFDALVTTLHKEGTRHGTENTFHTEHFMRSLRDEH